MEEKSTENGPFFSELLRFALITLAIVLPIRFFVAEPFIVNGASMVPTFQNGEYLIVDQLSYRFDEPKRGEVIIFRYPENPSKYFIKRIIGLPGETVDLRSGEVYIINTEYPDGVKIDESYIPQKSVLDNGAYPLGDEQYFVMGDNRTASSDSRVWGPLGSDFIVGQALLRLKLLPPGIQLLPGDHSE